MDRAKRKLVESHMHDMRREGNTELFEALQHVVNEARKAEDPIGLGFPTFQQRVAPWFYECFPPHVCEDKRERCDRFLEEALELVQASGYTSERAKRLVDYVFNRPVGKLGQEAGGVMITFAAFCITHHLDMLLCGEVELQRISDPAIMEKIRQKQASKRDIHGPLP